ncbi:GNAT family N-acetyltransferase [Leekyejoonella antrihumi]|uniref:GNAT family N-acetyltransferase n=1 Tax=Leekyejoonella antrihumi TaxID=1660198 RepID=UPI0016445FDA|nr:GNAT family N-acetyltransferase [Leekyejoonella antrihumi]
MAKSAVRVSRVTAEDADASEQFAALWTQSRVDTGQSVEWAERAVREGLIRGALARDDVRVYLAASGGRPVGYAVVMDGPLSGLADEPVVWIDQVYVRTECRRGGVSKSLLARIAHDGEAMGAGQIVSCVPTQAKELNRYFARLGFAPAITERTISPAQLLRHLASGEEAEPQAMAIVRRRRSLRARARARVEVAHTGT